MTPPVSPTPAQAPRRRTSPGVQIALAVFAVAFAALLHVHLRLAVLQAGYDVSRETQRKHELEDQNQKLRLELLTRRDPSMIERRAREELGMAPPDPAAIRILTPDGRLVGTPPPPEKPVLPNVAAAAAARAGGHR